MRVIVSCFIRFELSVVARKGKGGFDNGGPKISACQQSFSFALLRFCLAKKEGGGQFAFYPVSGYRLPPQSMFYVAFLFKNM